MHVECITSFLKLYRSMRCVKILSGPNSMVVLLKFVASVEQQQNTHEHTRRQRMQTHLFNAC